MGELLGEDFGVAGKDKLYRCLDKLVEHKAALFSFLQQRWKALFHAKFEVLLYDLTSTYFESDPPDAGKRRFGYSREAAAGAAPAKAHARSVAAQVGRRQEGSWSRDLAAHRYRAAGPGPTRHIGNLQLPPERQRHREGSYLLRSNLTDRDPAQL
jgi:hypothetical protein